MNPLVDTRTEEWTWTLLDKFTEAPVGTLDGVQNGHLEQSIFNRIRTSGSLAWAGSAAMDWSKYRIQPTYTALTPSGTVSWSMGIYLPSTPATTYSDFGPGARVDLYDKLLVLDEDAVESTYTVAAGTVVTTAIGNVISGSSAYALTNAIQPSTETLRSAMTWSPGTSRLTIVNDLLAAINYFSLSVDRYGVYHASPYITPSQRAVVWNFADDEASIYTPDFTNEQDLFNVPNKIILVAQGDSSLPPLISVATNTDPRSTSSFPARGRWVTQVDTGVEATSQAILDAMAARRLAEASQPQSTLTILHAHLPLDLNAGVLFTNDMAARSSVLSVVQMMSIDCEPGALTQSKLLEVVTAA